MSDKLKLDLTKTPKPKKSPEKPVWTFFYPKKPLKVLQTKSPPKVLSVKRPPSRIQSVESEKLRYKTAYGKFHSETEYSSPESRARSMHSSMSLRPKINIASTTSTPKETKTLMITPKKTKNIRIYVRSSKERKFEPLFWNRKLQKHLNSLK